MNGQGPGARPIPLGNNVRSGISNVQGSDHLWVPHEPAVTDESETPPTIFLEVLRPSEIKSYSPPQGIVLVGDAHITRGSVFVIGGAPGVGKSRAAVALAEAGATGFEWFGHKVHARFKTLIVQNENGRFRLKQEFAELNESVMDDYVRITPPPPYGLCFERFEFREQLSGAVSDFKPDIVILDPWNAASRDEKAKSMLETFDWIRSVIPAGDDGPAIGIVAHTHKPKIGERSSGRALLNLLAGSYVLGSVPRCVFIMQAASDDVTDNRIVWTCCKNNDGEPGKRSAWERRNGLFEFIPSFDWDAFDFPDIGKDSGITEAQVAAVFQEGKLKLPRTAAVKRLMELTKKGKSACYEALKDGGKFSQHLEEEAELLTWKP
jgi:hypothetical protein